MWFQLFLGIVLVQIISFNLAIPDQKLLNETNRETEAIFAGVIKNISRVNSVLQELINNYEHLQKIYKSQENLDDESSDGEIDEVYKNKKTKEEYENKEGHSRSYMGTTTQNTPAKGGPATQMIWSDDDKPRDNSEIASSNGEESDVAKQSKNNEAEIKIEEKLPDTTPEPKLVAYVEQKPHKIKKKRKSKSLQVSNQNEAEVIFIDTHTSTTKRKTVKPSLEPMIELELNEHTSKPPTLEGFKTRYSKVSQSNLEPFRKRKKKKPEYLRLNLKQSKAKEPIGAKEIDNIESTNNRSADQKKVVEKNSDFFSPRDIWDEIISNKPILLQTPSKLSFDKMRKDGMGDKITSNQRYRQRSKDKVRERGRQQKTALVILAKKNQSTTTKRPLFDSSSGEGVKEEFQATVLREAYGDACLKLVVKKCFKACKQAGKVVCERFKCKSSYRESYTKHSKTGCLKEFNVKSRNKQQKLNGKKQKDKLVMADDDDDDDDNDNDDGDGGGNGGGSAIFRASGKSISGGISSKEFENVNANEYLKACLPHIQTETRRFGISELDFTNSTYHLPAEPPPTFNILRDKYERACKKISYDKCRNACRYAYNKVCESFNCNSSRKRAYNTACSRNCRSAYKNGKLKGNSDSSDSNSDSSDSS